METKRQRQVAVVIQKEMSVVLREEGSYIYGDALVTITNVKMTSDLGIARIYVSVYNTEDKEAVVKELWENLPRLRHELAKRIRRQVRRIPVVQFYIDDLLDQTQEVDLLFQKMRGNQNSTRSMKDALKAKSENDKQED